jgi:hypothetical protein
MINKELIKYAEQLKKIKSLSVVVGVPKNSKGASSKYPDGTEVLDVAYAHEMGNGKDRRSFLRNTFIIKKKEIDKVIQQQFKKLGKSSAENVMGLIGIGAENLVNDAFNTEGYGKWDKSERAEKEGGKTLRDTNLLFQSITYEVR